MNPRGCAVADPQETSHFHGEHRVRIEPARLDQRVAVAVYHAPTSQDLDYRFDPLSSEPGRSRDSARLDRFVGVGAKERDDLTNGHFCGPVVG